MTTIELIKILTKWSLESKEYEMLYFIYNEFNIGITIKFLYKIPDKNVFSSLNSFFDEKDNKQIDDKLCKLIKKSKYQRLGNFDNLYGYKI